MEHLGNIKDRQIFYINPLLHKGWFNDLPGAHWIVFTVAEDTDTAVLMEVVRRCLKNEVCYICCAGMQGSLLENLFDEEIVDTVMKQVNGTIESNDFEFSPMTTSHRNLDEGFWFATTVAQDDYKNIDKVVCIDFTTNGVKMKMVDLILKINSGWLPDNE